MNENQKITQSPQGEKTSTKRMVEVIELIRKIENAEKIAGIDSQKQQSSDRLQILPGNQTGIVSSLS